MHSYPFAIFLLVCSNLFAQQGEIITVRDSYLSIATDARAAGQGDIGAATSPDAFSQFWNPAKIIFSEEKFEVGLNQIVGGNAEVESISQINFNFYNKLNERSAYGFSLSGYATSVNVFIQSTLELAVAGAYALKLSDEFAMSVGGRYISLKDKAPFLLDLNEDYSSSLFGVDVSGYYFGNEKAFKSFNGRWRAGLHLSNLRGLAATEKTFIEIYAPSKLSAGLGFDFIFDQRQSLAVTAEYKTLLKEYTTDENGAPLIYGLEGAVAALGLEYAFKEKLALRSGYSYGINRATDTFFTLGAGFKSRQVDFDLAVLFGLSEKENPIRQNLRLSLTLDLIEILFGNQND